MITIVSGMARSGTSLTMQMLDCVDPSLHHFEPKEKP